MKRKVLFVCISTCLASLALSSCEENEDVFTENSLQISVTNSDAEKLQTKAAYSGFETHWENGDAVGIYAVDRNGNIVSSNVKFTYQNGNWVAAADVKYNVTYKYYAYFPYIESPYTPSLNQTSLDQIFASFISDADNKFWKEDQSSKANFTASNLMVAKGDIRSDEKVNFSMLHKRALAVILMSGGDACTTYCYSTNPDVTTPIEMEGIDIAYMVDESLGYYLMKPGVPTAFGSQVMSGSAGKYAQTVNNTKVPDDYTLQYSTSVDRGNNWSNYSATRPDWLSLSAETSGGFVDKFTISCANTKTTDIKTSVSDSPNTIALRNAAQVSGYRDLSMYNNAGTTRGSRTTANCYLVHAAGTYKLPLVYGNAIRNGSTNSLAYKATASGSNIKSNLVNHNNSNISDPWIKNNGVSVNGAKLIWQDVQGLISSVGIDGDYLLFEVSSANIKEGNAVIAATASGTVVWSWHIWVTPETLTNLSVVNTGNHTYNVAPVNVGWVTPAVNCDQYAGSQCKVKILSGGSELTEILVVQPDYIESAGGGASHYGYCPYYQWGRKDAEVPSNGTGNTAHTVWDIEGETVTEGYSSSSSTIGTTIQNPLTHYNSNNSYCPYNEQMYNYWDINQNGGDNDTTATKKTVYDPCPPDFCVPTGNLFYYIGNSSGGSWDSTNKGRIFNTVTPSLFFPASGCRGSLSASLGNVGSGGYSWSASGYSDNSHYAGNLNFDSGSSGWIYYGRSNGFPVRPVSEE